MKKVWRRVAETISLTVCVFGNFFPISFYLETVYVRRREIARFECVDNPQRNFIYEWIHPQGFVVSQENVMRIQPVKNSDFGHYVCKSISPSGPNPDRNIFVEEDLIQFLTSNPKTPG